METLAPAAARHLAPGELIDDDDLTVLDDVVAVALEEGMGLEGRFEVTGQGWVRVVDVLNAEKLLHLGDAFFGRRNGLLLEVDEVVTAFFIPLRPSNQARDEAGEEEVLVGRFLRLAADDQRCPGFIDQDVVDLVDDGEVAIPLNPLVQFGDHVVAQVVEAELVVRAVGDIRGVGFTARAWPQVDQPLVVRGVARLELIRRVVGDDADRQAEEAEDRTHPLGVATGQVVVDRDHVDTAAGQPVESGGHRRHESLALAGAHLGDLALVENGRAHELDIEMAHAEGALHGFAGRGEDLRQDSVHGVLDAVVLALDALLGYLAATLPFGVMAFFVRRFLGFPGVANLLANLVDEGAYLLVGARLHLGLQLVDPLHEGFDAVELAVVRVDEAAQEAKH